MDGREELNCPDDLAVTRFHDGDLAGKELAGVEEHLSVCPACSERVAVLRSLDDLVGPPTGEPLPERLLLDLQAIPDRAPARHRGVLHALAVVGTAAALLLLVLRGSEPPQIVPVELEPPSLRSRLVIALATPSIQSALWLGSLGDDARVPLQRIALDEDPGTARVAILRLAMLGRREAVPTLLRALDLPDRREAAIEALAGLGEPRAAARIARFLGEDPWREHSIRALVAIGGAGASRELAEALRRSDDEAVAHELIGALAAVDGRQGVASLLDFLDRPGLRECVIAAITGNAEKCTPHLAELAAGRNDRVAALALEVLEHMATPAAVRPVRDLLSDFDRRVAAVRVLMQIGNRDAAAALLSRPLDAEMRAELTHARPELLGEVLAYAEQEGAAIRARSVNLLAKVGTEEAFKALTALAGRNKDMESRVRRALRDRDLEAELTAVEAEPPRTGRRASGIY